METSNVAYFGEGISVSKQLEAAKALFENTISLLEKGGVIFKEKEVLGLLMQSVIEKAEKRELSELGRTNITNKKLYSLPEEYEQEGGGQRDIIWDNIDFEEIKATLEHRLNIRDAALKADYEGLKKIIRDRK